MDLYELINNSKEVVIFGTGNMGKLIGENIKRSTFFIDNDEKKWGTYFLNRPVHPPSILNEQDFNNRIIIVASMYYNQIAKQLTAIGLKQNLHFVDGRMLYDSIINSNKIEDFVSENRSMINEIAKKYHTNSNINKNDHIFGFCINNPVFVTKTSAVNYYFSEGKKSATLLFEIINELFPDSNDNYRLLEFASGYGCVTRHLVDKQNKWDITSCDIHEEAISFIENQLKSKAIISCTEPEKVNLKRNYYHVVFCLSFFSHMPNSSWFRWLKALYESVSPMGFLIFTTHGYKSIKYFESASLDDEGYWFSRTSEQLDLDTSIYGETIVSPTYVFNKIKLLENNPTLIKHIEGFWWEHQDLWIIQKGRA